VTGRVSGNLVVLCLILSIIRNRRNFEPSQKSLISRIIESKGLDVSEDLHDLVSFGSSYHRKFWVVNPENPLLLTV